MHRDSLASPASSIARAWRAFALALVAAAGVVTLVGSGGGLPGDCPSGTDCSGPPPAPAVDVRPRHVTLQVGASVTWTATPSNVGTNPAYQWSRSSDGGATWVDIAGATGPTWTVPSVSLADDQAQYRVTVQSGADTVRAAGQLVVSATPGLVFADGDFQPADWLVTPQADANEPAPVHVEERMATGGHPDAYWRMTFQLPSHALSGRVFYTSLVAGYDPRAQGAIHVIDYAEDSIALQASSTTSTASAMLLEQAGRRFLANARDSAPIIPVAWSAVEGEASLRAQDFRQVDGPACGTGESCPDFSAQGLPLRFGFWRISYGIQGDTIAHGIDNWQVTVWPQ